MSTDFSLDALLNGSSVISPPNKKQTPLSTATASPDATAAQLLSRISATLPTPPADQETSAGEKKRRNNKRKREEEDDDDKQKDISQPEPKKKRVRTAYTRQQLKRLEYMFAQNQYPDMLMRENIAEELGLPDQKIHVWFQNRRAKQRRLRGQPTIPFPSPAVCASILQCPPTSMNVPHPVGTPSSAPVYNFHPTHQKSTQQSATSLNVPHPVGTGPVYHFHPAQQKSTQQSVAVQTHQTARSMQQSRLPPLSLPTHTRPSPLSMSTHMRPSPLSMSTHSQPSPLPSYTRPSPVQNCPPSFCIPSQRSPLGALTPSPTPSPVDFRQPCSATPSPQSTPSMSSHHLQVSPPTGNTIPSLYPSPYSFMLPTTRTSPTDGQRVTFTSPFPYYHPQRNSSAAQAPMYFLDMTPPLSGNRVNSVIPAFPHFYQSQ